MVLPPQLTAYPIRAYDNFMKVAGLIGFLLAVVMGVLCIGQVDALRPTGSALGGGIGAIFDVSNILVMIVVGVVAISALVGVTIAVLRS